jgi:hypothetical protein
MQFPQSIDITQLTNSHTAVDSALRLTIAQALYEGAEDGDRTTDAITWTAATEGDMINIVRELRGLGYGVTEGSSTITITWA